jgi:hypothetical protein
MLERKKVMPWQKAAAPDGLECRVSQLAIEDDISRSGKSPVCSSLHAVITTLFHACLNIHYVPGWTDFVRVGLIVFCVRPMVLGLVHPGRVSSAAAGLVGPGLIGVLPRPTACGPFGPALVGVLPRRAAGRPVGPGPVCVLVRRVAGLVNPRLVGVLSENNTCVA